MLDIKSGAPAAWHREQVAAYALACGLEIDGGIVVYLKPSGRYSIKQWLGPEWAMAKETWTGYVHKFYKTEAIA